VLQLTVKDKFKKYSFIRFCETLLSDILDVCKKQENLVNMLKRKNLRFILSINDGKDTITVRAVHLLGGQIKHRNVIRGLQSRQPIML